MSLLGLENQYGEIGKQVVSTLLGYAFFRWLTN